MIARSFAVFASNTGEAWGGAGGCDCARGLATVRLKLQVVATSERAAVWLRGMGVARRRMGSHGSIHGRSWRTIKVQQQRRGVYSADAIPWGSRRPVRGGKARGGACGERAAALRCAARRRGRTPGGGARLGRAQQHPGPVCYAAGCGAGQARQHSSRKGDLE